MPPLRRLLMCLVLLLASGCSEKDATIFEKTKKRAEAGDTEAQFDLGNLYHNGTGVPKEHLDTEAEKWYRKAAEQEDSLAQFILGNMYANGTGVPKDDVEAYAWFNISAVSYEPAKNLRDNLKLTLEEKARGQKRATELLNQIEVRKKAAGK